MKLTIDPAELKSIVTYAQAGIDKRYSQTIMTGMLLAANDGELRATGATMEQHASAITSADVIEPGKILIPGQSISAAVSRMRGKNPVQISVNDTQAIIAQGAKVFSINLMPIEEYPVGITDPMPAIGTVDGSALAHTVGLVEGAAASPNQSATLSGVLLRIESDRISATATDRYRIAIAETGWEPAEESRHDLLVAADWLRFAAKNIAAETTIHTDGTQIAITSGGYTTSTRLMSGDYPKIKSLFDNIGTEPHTVERAAFLDAVDTVAVMADASAPVRLTARKGVISIDAGGTEGTGIAQVRTSSDDEFQIAVNPTYLLWTLRAHGSDEITFTPNGARPILIGGDSGAQHLIMPVRL